MEEPPGNLIELGEDVNERVGDSSCISKEAPDEHVLNASLMDTSALNISTLTYLSNNSYNKDRLLDMYANNHAEFVKKLKNVIRKATVKSRFLNPSTTTQNVGIERVQSQYQASLDISTTIKTFCTMLEDIIDTIDEDDELYNQWLQLQTLDQEYEIYKHGYTEIIDEQGEPLATSGRMEDILTPSRIDNITVRKKAKSIAKNAEESAKEYRDMLADLSNQDNALSQALDLSNQDNGVITSKARPSIPISGNQEFYPKVGQNQTTIIEQGEETTHDTGNNIIKSTTNQLTSKNRPTVPMPSLIQSNTQVSDIIGTGSHPSHDRPPNTGSRDISRYVENSLLGKSTTRYSQVYSNEQRSGTFNDRRSGLFSSTRNDNSERPRESSRDFGVSRQDSQSRSVRFPEENDQITELEGSWRDIVYDSNVLSELTMIKTIKSISKITSTKLSEKLCDTEILAIDKNKKPGLERLNENLNKLIDKIPEDSTLLQKYAVEAYRASSEWTDTLEDMIIKRRLHLTSERKYSEPLKLSKFKGHDDPSTNIYEFFKLFEIVARGFTQEDRAHYLFSNYLDEDPKRVVKHLRTEFNEMKKKLIDKYGDVNRLLSTKKNQIRALPSIHYRSNSIQKLEYIRGFAEVLDQIQTLVLVNMEDYPSMEVEIYSHSNVMDLSALLPVYLHEEFTKQYVHEKLGKKVENIPGKISFQILMNVLRQQMESLEFRLENYTENQEKRKDKGGDVKNVDKRNRDQNHVLAFENNDRFIKSVCFVHKDLKKSYKDCNTGKCPVFLNMKPGDRLIQAIEKKICNLCFLHMCIKRSPDKCFYSTKMPQALICKGCAAEKVERNVLLCGTHRNESPEVMNAMKNMLVGFEEGTSVTLKHFMHAENPNPLISVMKSATIETRKNNHVFDVTTGELLEKSDVLHKINPDSKELAIYPMQVLNISGHRTLVLYDSGAMGEAITADLANKVGMTIVDSRPQSFRVAGGGLVNTNNPLFETTIGPDSNGEYYSFTMLGMERISQEIPLLDLTQITEEFRRNQVSSPLSKEICPSFIGGSQIQLIIGIRQSSLFPTRVMVLSNGLQVWRSPIKDIFGSSLIFAGPHSSIRKAYSGLKLSNFEGSFSAFFHSSFNIYRELESFVSPRYNVKEEVIDGSSPSMACINYLTPIDQLRMTNDEAKDVDKEVDDLISFQEDDDSTVPIKKEIKDTNIPFLFLSKTIECIPLCKATDDDLETAVKQVSSIYKKSRTPRMLEKAYEEEEEVGAVVDYRCSSCNGCKLCLQGDKLRSISIREEAEQLVIENSVTVDIKSKITTCVYPFNCNPAEYLSKKWGNKKSNLKQAESVLRLQRTKSEEVRKGVVQFHEEVESKGFVAKLKDLPKDVQQEILEADFQHFFAWRSVFKESLSTKCRLVVDPTVSSFNDTIVKGVNCLTSLFSIMINFRSYRYSFTSDISKMFNTVKLEQDMYKYSLYLFSTSLDPKEDYEIWVILTLMYGLKSAANQCTYALQKVAEMLKNDYPYAYTIIMKYTYMDDSSGGANDKLTLDKMVEEMKNLLPFGGFQLKVLTVSGTNPCEKASSDGIATTFGGYKWKPKDDILMLNSSEINFNPKRRGVKKPNGFTVETDEDVENLVATKKLSRKVLLGKTLELFDISGLFEPLKVRMKLDLQLLKLFDYDEDIPLALRGRWVHNLKVLNNARMLECSRTFIPEDAVNPDKIELLVLCDAAVSMCGAAVYGRLKLKDGGYSCQLIASKSKSTHSTIPRNELEGCTLAAQLAFTVAKSLGDRVEGIIFATDSTISVCWISNLDNKLKQFVNTRVKLIHRLMGSDKFYHIAGVNNPADLLTRGNVDCCDVEEGSRWQIGDPWMILAFEDMPLKSYSDLCSGLSKEESDSIKVETHPVTPTIQIISDTDLEFQLSIFTDPNEYELSLSDCKGNACMCQKIFQEEIDTSEENVEEEDVLNKDDTNIADKKAIRGVNTQPTIGDTVYNNIVTEAIVDVEDDEEEDVLNKDDNNIADEKAIRGVNTQPTIGDTEYNNTITEAIVDSACDNAYQESVFKITKSSIDEDANEIQSKYMIDFVKHGFEKSFKIIAIVFKYFLRLRHRAHLRKDVEIDDNCKICCVKKEFRTNGLEKIQPIKHNDEKVDGFNNDSRSVLICSPLDFYVAWHYICKIGTIEVKNSYKNKPDYLKDFTERDGVLFGAGRLSHSEVKLNNPVENPLFKDIDFFQPVFLNTSTVTYALCMHAHWKLCPHSGIDRTMTFVSNIVYVAKLRKIVKYIRETCLRCRFLVKKFLTPITGNQALYSLMRAPPFFSCMIDIAGTYDAHDSVKKRVRQDAYFLVQVCMVTGATAIGVLENLSVTSVIMALARSSSRYGCPKYVLLDNQSSFKKLNDVSFSFKDMQGKLWSDQKIILDFSTPLAHNTHGRVEVKIRALKEFLNKSAELQRKHSYIEWETIGMNIAATINGLPICHSQDDRGIHNDLGLLTPNMFLIGRNNNRSPDAFMKVEHDPSKALKDLEEADQKLFDLLGDYVHRFIPGRKLIEGEQPAIDDIVLFVSKESQRSRNTKFKFGKVIATMVDGRQNKVTVEYQNATEAVRRVVDRCVKDLVLIKGSDEIDFNSSEHQLASAIQQRYL